MEDSLINYDGCWILNEEPTSTSQQHDPERLRLGKIDCGGEADDTKKI